MRAKRNERATLLHALATYAYKQAPAGEEFRLSSGLTSNVVIDASLVTRHHKVFRRIGSTLDKMLPSNEEFDVVAGPSSGADPMGAATLMVRNVRWCSIRKTAKHHGFDTGLATGPIKASDRVVIVDDVLTTGGSMVRAVQAIKDLGCTVLGVIVLVDREEFDGRKVVQDCVGPNAFFKSMFTLSDIKQYRSQM